MQGTDGLVNDFAVLAMKLLPSGKNYLTESTVMKMAEYIEREAVIRKLNKIARELLADNSIQCSLGAGVVVDIRDNVVMKQSAADVAEVRHGEWVEKQETVSWLEDDVDVFYECSICETRAPGESPYCPNCGAKMDGKDG